MYMQVTPIYIPCVLLYTTNSHLRIKAAFLYSKGWHLHSENAKIYTESCL